MTTFFYGWVWCTHYQMSAIADASATSVPTLPLLFEVSGWLAKVLHLQTLVLQIISKIMSKALL